MGKMFDKLTKITDKDNELGYYANDGATLTVLDDIISSMNDEDLKQVLDEALDKACEMWVNQ